MVEQGSAVLGQELRCYVERRQYFLKGLVFDQNRPRGLNKDLCVWLCLGIVMLSRRTIQSSFGEAFET